MKANGDSPVDRHPRKDAVSLLTADHESLLGYFDQLRRLAHDPYARRCREELAAKITGLLKLHLEIENTIFYPAAVLSKCDESVTIESSFEQDDEQYVIEQLEALSMDDPYYDEVLSSLAEQLREHVLEEETEIFPRLKAARVDMVALGIKIRRRQRGLG